MRKIISSNRWYLALMAISLVLLPGCKEEYSLKEFVNQIAPGYTPLSRRAFNDEIRIGFVRPTDKDDFIFDSKVIALSGKKLLAPESRFTLDSKILHKAGADFAGVIGFGLALSKAQQIQVQAKEIYVYYIPSDYKIYVDTTAQIESYRMKNILKEVIEISELKLKLSYAKGYDINAELSKIPQLAPISNVAVQEVSNSQGSFSVTYKNLILAYRSELIDASKIVCFPDNITVYGKVADEKASAVKAYFTDGTASLSTSLDANNMYMLNISPNALDKIIVVNKKGEEILKKSFIPQKATYQYDFP